MATVDNPNNIYASTPIAGININRRTNTTTETNPAEHALGMTVLLIGKVGGAGYTTNATRRLAMYVQAVNGAILANNQVTVSYPTVEASSVSTGLWLCPSAAFASGDFGWVIENAALV